jgi:hypothetical protein
MKSLLLIGFIFWAMGALCGLSPKSGNVSKAKPENPRDWSDMPLRQDAEVNVSPYKESLTTLVPAEVGQNRLSKPSTEIMNLWNSKEARSAFYDAPGGSDKQVHVMLFNFASSDDAYLGMRSEMASSLVHYIVKKETAVKDNQPVGTKVTFSVKPNYGVFWTHGTVMLSVCCASEAEIEDFYRKFPY